MKSGAGDAELNAENERESYACYCIRPGGTLRQACGCLLHGFSEGGLRSEGQSKHQSRCGCRCTEGCHGHALARREFASTAAEEQRIGSMTKRRQDEVDVTLIVMGPQ